MPETSPERELVESEAPLTAGDELDATAAEAKTPAEPSIGRASAVMAAGTMVSRVLGLVRQSMLTACVGLSIAGDAFQVANTTPNYVYILLSAGVLNAILIPQITKAMKNADGGQDFVDRLLTAAFLLVGAVTVIATLCTPLIIRATTNFSGDAFKLAVMFGYVCLPQIAFYALYAVLGQVLNTRNKFAAFMWTPVLANVIQISGLAYFLWRWGRLGPDAVWSWTMVWVLAGSTTLGIVVQGLALIPPLVRSGFRWRPRFGWRGHGFGSTTKMLGWTFTALLIAQLGGFVVQWIITWVVRRNPHVPGVLARDNAFLLFMLPHSFVTTSILTALFPRLTRAFQEADRSSQRRLMRQGLEMPAVLVFPMSAGLIALSFPIFRVLFPGLHPHEAAAEAWILAAMALGTMAFGVTTLQQRYCFAREEGRKNLWLQVLLTAVQVGVACLAFVVPARWAVVTIALGQTLANTVAGVAFVLVARRDLGGIGLHHTVRLYVRLIFVSTLAGLMAWGASEALVGLGESLVLALGRLALGGAVFGLAFLGWSRVFHIREVLEVITPVLRRLRIVR